MKSHRLARLAACLVLLGACNDSGNGTGDGNGGGGDGGTGEPDACVGLQCDLVQCEGGAKTTVTGIVQRRPGTCPSTAAPILCPERASRGAAVEGVSCDRCGELLSGSPVVQHDHGHERQVRPRERPRRRRHPLVIQTGKWRRSDHAARGRVVRRQPITDRRAAPAEEQSEGDIPQLALTTGGADALECLLRKIGIDDAEFTTASGDGRVHLTARDDGDAAVVSSGAGGATSRGPSRSGAARRAQEYDVVFLACEGDQNPDTKPMSRAPGDAGLHGPRRPRLRLPLAQLPGSRTASRPGTTTLANVDRPAPTRSPTRTIPPTALEVDVSTAPTKGRRSRSGWSTSGAVHGARQDRAPRRAAQHHAPPPTVDRASTRDDFTGIVAHRQRNRHASVQAFSLQHARTRRRRSAVRQGRLQRHPRLVGRRVDDAAPGRSRATPSTPRPQPEVPQRRAPFDGLHDDRLRLPRRRSSRYMLLRHHVLHRAASRRRSAPPFAATVRASNSHEVHHPPGRVSRAPGRLQRSAAMAPATAMGETAARATTRASACSALR